MGRFIVTGTPRSATRYASKLFEACGVPCRHESALRPSTSIVDVARWFNDRLGAGESTWMGWTVLPLLDADIPVFHTIRNPWDVIDSLCNRNAIFKDQSKFKTNVMVAIRDMINAFCPGVMDHNNRVDRVADFVVSWNQRIAEAAPYRFTYRVDALDVKTYRAMLHHIGKERSESVLEKALATTPTNVNSGYTVTETNCISDPLVEKFVLEMAEQTKCNAVFTRKLKNKPDYSTPQELAAGMKPELLERVNNYAQQYGYLQVPSLTKE